MRGKTKMSQDSKTLSTNKVYLNFDPVLPDSGLLYYEECPEYHEIERPRLLPLKTTTQLRFEQLQHEASRLWKEKQTRKN